jgi:hypothetical protein
VKRLLVILMSCAIQVMAAVPETASTEAPPVPLGVYWPGEFTFRDQQIPKLRWKKIEATLDLLASNHVNAVWLTHVNAEEGADFARRAANRGIYLVASLGELAGENPAARQGGGALMESVLKNWGDAPKPIAWGLGDEPRAEYMAEMASYSEPWKKAKQPVTTVVMSGDIPTCGAVMKPTFLCTDVYPFFSAGNPNGPGDYAASTTYFLDSGRSAQRWSEGDWWMMGQIFSEVWGPRDIDKDGNVVYLPGGGPHWRMPTPAEVRWQTWSSIACGARGVFYFSLFFNAGAATNAAPLEAKAQFAVSQPTPSGLPASILYMDGRTTPLLAAMGESFAAVTKVAPLIKTLKLVDERFAFVAKGWRPAGTVVQPFVGTEGQRYAVVVNGDFQEAADVAVNVSGDVTAVQDLVSAQTLPLLTKALTSWEPIGSGFQQVRVKLAPGDGTLLRLERGSEGK